MNNIDNNIDAIIKRSERYRISDNAIFEKDKKERRRFDRESLLNARKTNYELAITTLRQLGISELLVCAQSKEYINDDSISKMISKYDIDPVSIMLAARLLDDKCNYKQNRNKLLTLLQKGSVDGSKYGVGYAWVCGVCNTQNQKILFGKTIAWGTYRCGKCQYANNGNFSVNPVIGRENGLAIWKGCEFIHFLNTVNEMCKVNGDDLSVFLVYRKNDWRFWREGWLRGDLHEVIRDLSIEKEVFVYNVVILRGIKKTKVSTPELNSNLANRKKPVSNKKIVVVSTSSCGKGYEDFMFCLGNNKKLVDIVFTHGNSLAQTLNNIKLTDGDIVAIVRGGGDINHRSFEGYFGREIIKEINRLKSVGCKVIAGVGHMSDITDVCKTSSFNANTPSLAGVHINKLIERATTTLKS